MTLNEWIVHVYNCMAQKGFHDGRSCCGRDDTLVRLCLIHTEVSEAAQEVKRHGVTMGNRGAIAEELADVVIRVFDLCGCLGLDLEQAVKDKMAKNMARPRCYGTPNEAK